MKNVKIRNLVLGKGMPKICVPIVGITKQDICEAADTVMSLTGLPDIIEFRADWFEHIFDKEQMQDVLKEIRRKIGEIPLLFTFRTAREGGEKAAAMEEYQALLLCAAESGYIDAVDVEAFSFGVSMEGLVERLHGRKMVVVGSSHDFSKTPGEEEMLSRLYRMRECRMDIAKLAVMPENREDVLKLLDVTRRASGDEKMCPVITMSMAREGLISRLSGEIFGSVLTFASAGRASAPGQIEADKLRQVLEIIHESSCPKEDRAAEDGNG